MDQLVHGAPESVRTLDVQLIRADESVIHAEVVGSNLLETPDVRGIVLTIRDVSGRRALEDQLRHQAFHDALTTCPTVLCSSTGWSTHWPASAAATCPPRRWRSSTSTTSSS